MQQSKHIAVVGAGPIGQGIAQLFAAKGHEVTFFDRDETVLKEATERIESKLVFLTQNGVDLARNIQSVIERIKVSANLKEAITDARLVVETVEENLEAKQSFFREMEAYCSPVTVFCTHAATSSISEIAAKIKNKNRVVGTRFWFPPALIPLVEIMGSRHTFPEVKEYVRSLFLSVGLHPVLINGDVPDFVGRRLLQALKREASSLVDQGIVTPETVDEVIKAGIGIRLCALGLYAGEDDAELVRQLVDWNQRKTPESQPQTIKYTA